MTTDPYWQTARGPAADGKPLLTPKQLEILELSRHNAMSLRSIAAYLDISLSSVRDTLRRAEQKVEIHMRTAYFTERDAAA